MNTRTMIKVWSGKKKTGTSIQLRGVYIDDAPTVPRVVARFHDYADRGDGTAVGTFYRATRDGGEIKALADLLNGTAGADVSLLYMLGARLRKGCFLEQTAQVNEQANS